MRSAPPRARSNATAFLRAGASVSDRLNLDAAGVATLLGAALQGIQDRAAPSPATRP